ncbi:hypothetical protein LXL04_001883 [Taraxacum kok-saghyz]
MRDQRSNFQSTFPRRLGSAADKKRGTGRCLPPASNAKSALPTTSCTHTVQSNREKGGTVEWERKPGRKQDWKKEGRKQGKKEEGIKQDRNDRRGRKREEPGEMTLLPSCASYMTRLNAQNQTESDGGTNCRKCLVFKENGIVFSLSAYIPSYPPAFIVPSINHVSKMISRVYTVGGGGRSLLMLMSSSRGDPSVIRVSYLIVLLPVLMDAMGQSEWWGRMSWNKWWGRADDRRGRKREEPGEMTLLPSCASHMTRLNAQNQTESDGGTICRKF